MKGYDIFFRFEEKSAAYRMYYKEDVEIEIQGKKYKKKKGEGPLVEDFMSFNGGDVCIIDNDIFIPKEVRIGNNVVIRNGTCFLIDNNSGFVDIKDNTVIEGSKIHTTVDKTSKRRVEINSSKIVNSIIEDSFIVNSKVVDSCAAKSKVKNSDLLRVKLFDSELSYTNAVDSVIEISKISEKSTVENMEARSVILNSCVVKGSDSEPVIIKNIGFSHSRIESNFPNSIDKDALAYIPIFDNASIKSMFDACFVENRFFYRKIKLYDTDDTYENGRLWDKAIIVKTVRAADIVRGKLKTKVDENNTISSFVYENIKTFLSNNICNPPRELNFKKYSVWRVLYADLIKNRILDIINRKDISKRKEIMNALHVDISKKSFSGNVVFIDCVTFEMLEKKMTLKTGNVVLI